MALFANIYCGSVSHSFLKTAVFTVLRTLSYYSRTKVPRMEADQNDGYLRYPGNICRMLSYSPRVRLSPTLLDAN